MTEREQYRTAKHYFESDISVIKGVGEKRAELLRSMGLRTVGDVLYHFPFRYRDRTRIQPLFFRVPEGEVLFRANVSKKYLSKNSLFLEVRAELAKIRITYFHSRFLGERFTVGGEYYFFGTIRDGAMANPEFAPVEDESFLGLIPVYPTVEGLGRSVMERIHENAVAYVRTHGIEENLPEEVIASEQLISRSEAILALHSPEDFESVERAKKRVVFEELYLIFERSLSARVHQRAPVRKLKMPEEKIPFELTDAQRLAVADIRRDLESGTVMNRLVNGDVGSGKSVVAYLASKMMADAGVQVLFMAPTLVLANQLYTGYTRLYGTQAAGILTSALPKKEREALLDDLRSGRVRVLFGTHAVLSEEVVFRNLELVIVDEQQRFGTLQRRKALEKANVPNSLYLTATPIPRTLAMTFFSYMDVSMIREKPPSRAAVKTREITKKDYPAMFAFIQSRIDEGEQVYVVTPSIRGERESVTAAERTLRKYLNARIRSVHGEKKSDEIEREMQDFKSGKFDVLVSTTIVEVGVDNPNATIMAIVGCERFGLSQLHQLRGRVGRGQAKSHCFLISEHDVTDRMRVLLESDDGFVIAEKDLEIRGPGEFLGLKQSGEFRCSFEFDRKDMMTAYQAAKRQLGIK